jgi:uncharacterized membrane protein
MAVDTRTHSSSMLSRIISTVFGVIAFILVVHIAFVLLGTNASNGIVHAVSDLAGTLAWGFKNLFSNANVKLQTFINCGLAALAYLAIGTGLQRLFRNVG